MRRWGGLVPEVVGLAAMVGVMMATAAIIGYVILILAEFLKGVDL